MLVRANQLMGNGSRLVDPHDDSVPALAGLLMSALEELKVAEEELREQNERLHERRLADERRLRHYEQLFMHIPAPALLTDMNANVLEASRDTRKFPLTLQRVGNLPVKVNATVSVVPGGGPTGSGALLWLMDGAPEEG
jgi:hypothetical protein